MDFFRKIFILQLAGLVLTYNFTDCDFEKIKQKYQKTIYNDLKEYMNGAKSTQFNSTVSCNNKSDCLAEIERLTFSAPRGCAPLAREAFALRTRATFALQCPGYSRTQTNNTQAAKKTKEREITTKKCLEQVSQLLGLWGRFCRTLWKRSKRSLLQSYLSA
ncbi:thymic stromal lymphopoietin [Microcebus murinus]|uniref:thymic stromal lymphopoietin n=1 Tax=Microcebus murinus TaxID=30608 RepID=UPI003F6C1C22